jgi:nitrile hydratase beta subunit
MSRMSVSDLGGRRERFASIAVDDSEGFHASWEKRAFGTAMLGGAALLGGNVDAMRASMERLPPGQYFKNYWGRWLGGLELELERQGVLALGEVDAFVEGRTPRQKGSGRPTLPNRIFARLAAFSSRPLPRWMIAIAVRVMSGSRRARSAPRFQKGDDVRTIATRPSGHTRLPGYACGKRGTVIAHHGAMALPDSRARFEGDAPEHLYTVRFEGRELWGDEAEPASSVCLDLFESYLEAR